MIYLDTSAVVPLLVRERESPAVRARIAALPPAELAISGWTITEFVSAVGIKVRMRELDPRTGGQVVSAFFRITDESLTILMPAPEDFVLAQQYLERFDAGLRAGDALHLAIASNNDARQMYSLDRALLQSAQKLKLEMQLLAIV